MKFKIFLSFLLLCFYYIDYCYSSCLYWNKRYCFDGPMAKTDVLQRFRKKLTEYEVKELKLSDIDTVFYLPLKVSKKERRQTEAFSLWSNDFPHILRDNHIAFRYKIEKLAVSGGYGIIVKAVDMKDQSIVAIKFNNKDLHVSNNEHRILNILNTDFRQNNIVQLIDRVQHYGWDGLVFPWFQYDLDNILTDYLKKGALIAPQFLIKLVKDMKTALLYLKSKSIVHLDLKPANILVEIDEETGQPTYFLCDFGVTRTENELSRYFNVQSTISILAPEVLLKAAPVTASADMWSLGVTIFVLLTGESLVSSSGPYFTVRENIFSNLLQRVPPEEDSKTVNRISIPYWLKLDNFSVSDFTLILARKRIDYAEQFNSDPKVMKEFDSLVLFIRKCLLWNPGKRLKVEDIMM